MLFDLAIYDTLILNSPKNNIGVFSGMAIASLKDNEMRMILEATLAQVTVHPDKDK